MKALSLILCLIVTVQVFTFCTDRIIVKKEIGSVVSFAKQQLPENAAEQHADGDVCSPFCHCTCCATPSVAQSNLFIIQLSLTGNNSFKNPDPLGFIDVSIPVWQPPQLV